MLRIIVQFFLHEFRQESIQQHRIIFNLINMSIYKKKKEKKKTPSF